jgi:hypothetical protein
MGDQGKRAGGQALVGKNSAGATHIQKGGKWLTTMRLTAWITECLSPRRQRVAFVQVISCLHPKCSSLLFLFDKGGGGVEGC